MHLLEISAEEAKIVLIGIFVVLLILLAIASISTVAVKNKDKGKYIERKHGAIIEKTFSQGKTEWYIVQFDDGTRVKLRNLNADTMILSHGDRGYFEYQGQTILSFYRT